MEGRREEGRDEKGGGRTNLRPLRIARSLDILNLLLCAFSTPSSISILVHPLYPYIVLGFPTKP